MLRILFASLILIISSLSTSADSLLVNQGSVSIFGSSGHPGFFFFSGPNVGLSANTNGLDQGIGPLNSCGVCPAGASIPMSSSVLVPYFEWFGGGVVTVNGTTYQINNNIFGPPIPGTARLNVTMEFVSGVVTVPITLDSLVTLTSPFTMTGQFMDNGPGSQFSEQVAGNGLATLVLNRNGNLFQFQSVTYTFQTPEPTTLPLAFSGLIGLIIGKRRFRPGKETPGRIL